MLNMLYSILLKTIDVSRDEDDQGHDHVGRDDVGWRSEPWDEAGEIREEDKEGHGAD